MATAGLWGDRGLEMRGKINTEGTEGAENCVSADCGGKWRDPKCGLRCMEIVGALRSARLFLPSLLAYKTMVRGTTCDVRREIVPRRTK